MEQVTKASAFAIHDYKLDLGALKQHRQGKGTFTSGIYGTGTLNKRSRRGKRRANRMKALCTLEAKDVRLSSRAAFVERQMEKKLRVESHDGRRQNTACIVPRVQTLRFKVYNGDNVVVCDTDVITVAREAATKHQGVVCVNVKGVYYEAWRPAQVA